MKTPPTLTIAVPLCNKEEFIARNLDSLLAANCESVEILVLDNASTDRSGQIADEYKSRYPQILSVIHKEDRGYGSSINLAIEKANGRYMRIVDADDWVNAEELSNLVAELEEQTADLILMPYRKVNMSTGEEICCDPAPGDWKRGDIQCSFEEQSCPVPQLHGTVFRVEFLRREGIRLLEDTYYVDEQLMLWSYTCAESACKLGTDVYRYMIGSTNQSISAINKGIHWKDRERVIGACIRQSRIVGRSKRAKRTCPEQLLKNIGDHFTTLYMYVLPRKKGRVLARRWQEYLLAEVPDFWRRVRRRARILYFLNLLNVSEKGFEKMKNSSMMRSLFRI